MTFTTCSTDGELHSAPIDVPCSEDARQKHQAAGRTLHACIRPICKEYKLFTPQYGRGIAIEYTEIKKHGRTASADRAG
jgi:hypothetical protein